MACATSAVGGGGSLFSYGEYSSTQCRVDTATGTGTGTDTGTVLVLLYWC
jgi:hypothetical protein